MSKVYEIQPDGTTTSMTRVRCVNEDAELQSLLERNLDLMPGDQMDPEDPVRWLLVKREMPVPDPNTGVDRWSIDFLLLDQSAMPTFVECKRYTDTRSRREVVGQMLEYAANGHHYWTSAQLREMAEATARSRGVDLESALRSIRPRSDMDLAAFFDRAEENLRQGEVRVVFFMEESSYELRSVVEFLNRQTERTEVLLVEARQYELGGRRVVVPSLFGYTEQARLAKKTSNDRSPGERRKWNASLFFEDAAGRLGPNHTAALRHFLELREPLRCEVSWGTGKERGSYSFKSPDITKPSFVSVYSDGTLALNLGFLSDGGNGDLLKDRLRTGAQSLRLQFKPGLEQDYPALGIEEWSARADDLANVIKEALTAVRERLAQDGL